MKMIGHRLRIRTIVEGERAESEHKGDRKVFEQIRTKSEREEESLVCSKIPIAIAHNQGETGNRWTLRR
jgi:hypothetical protein